MFEQPPPLSEVDVLESPDAVAAELASSLPRAEDISALVLLDPEALSDAGPVDLLVGFERHVAQLQAAQQQVLASLDGRVLDWSGKKLIDYTREQVGAALRLSPGTAERRLSIGADPPRAATRHFGPAAAWAAHLPARHETRRSRYPVRCRDDREGRAAGAASRTGADPGPIRHLTAARRDRRRPTPRRTTPRRRDHPAAGGVHPTTRRHHRTVGTTTRRRCRAHPDRAQLPRQRPDR